VRVSHRLSVCVCECASVSVSVCVCVCVCPRSSDSLPSLLSLSSFFSLSFLSHSLIVYVVDSVCKAIIGNLQVQWAILLSMDSFYFEVDRSKDGCAQEVFDHNFDHPASLDWSLLLSTLQQLKEGKNVSIPQYNMETLSRSSHNRQVYGADVILLEGTFALYDSRLRNLMDIKIFLETDSDVRLARRLRRDTHDLGRDMYKVLEQYQRFVKPGYEDFVEPVGGLRTLLLAVCPTARIAQSPSPVRADPLLLDPTDAYAHRSDRVGSHRERGRDAETHTVCLVTPQLLGSLLLLFPLLPARFVCVYCRADITPMWSFRVALTTRSL
jgi:uridine kinase